MRVSVKELGFAHESETYIEYLHLSLIWQSDDLNSWTD